MKYVALILSLILAYPNTGYSAQKKPGDSCDIEDYATIEEAVVASKLTRESPRNQIALSEISREKFIQEYSKNPQSFDDLYQKGGKMFLLNVPKMQPGEQFDFYVFKINQMIEYNSTFVANANGELVSTTKQAVPFSNLTFSLYDQMRGEELSYVLLSKDKSRCLAISYASDPIEARWKDGGKIYMAMLTSDMKIFYLYGDQLKPGEVVTLSFNMADKKFSEDFVASPQGTFYAILNHDMLGRSGGKGSVRVSKKSTGEDVSLAYLWGEDLKEAFRSKKFH